jgi:hypothetical protein
MHRINTVGTRNDDIIDCLARVCDDDRVLDYEAALRTQVKGTLGARGLCKKLSEGRNQSDVKDKGLWHS